MPWLCTRGHIRPTCSVKPPRSASQAPLRVHVPATCKVCGELVVRVNARAREGVGYHYCPASAWRAIKQEGMRPYSLASGAVEGKDELLAMLGDMLAVYLWAQPFSGATHVGNLVARCLVHRTWHMTLLRARFPLRDLINTPQILAHTGTFSSAKEPDPWTYHTNEPFLLVSRTIPPESIELVGDFNLEAALR
jgi:hypothetical protein